MSSRPHSPQALAEARRTVTSFDALMREHGLAEARDLRNTAWEMLADDRAARLSAAWQGYHAPRDAA